MWWGPGEQGTGSDGDRHRPAPVTGPAGGHPWVVVRHVPHEPPGLVADALGEAGLPFDLVAVDLADEGARGGGAAVEALERLAPSRMGGLVVMGGPMGVHDDSRSPWLAAERDALRRAVDAGIPVLGICLGAQQLAAACGAEVTTGDHEEVGLGSVMLTAAGRLDPVFGPEYGGLADPTIPCVHWHRDTFSLPEGAVHLAATRSFAHQAFRIRDRVYGLQFHVEVDEELAATWRPLMPAGAEIEGPRLAAVTSVGRRLLRRFVAVAGSPSTGAPRGLA